MTPEEFRSHFPIFAQRVHLCSCSEGALSDLVEEAMAQFMESWRARGAPWDEWMAQVDAARRSFAELIHADPDEVAAVSCASEGAYHVASALDWQRRPEIVSAEIEFPSIAHVWLAQGPRGARVRYAGRTQGVELEDYQGIISGATGLVSVPLAAYAHGFRPPVREVVAAAHAVGAYAFVDAYQGLGVVPVDVRELGCDFLVAGALKYLLGAPGIAFLYVRRDVAERLRSPLTGWFARREPFAFDPHTLDHASGALRFQTGTPAIPAAYAAAAGMELLQGLDAADVFAHVQALAGQLQEILLGHGVELTSPRDPARRGPQIAVRTDRSHELGAFLAARGVLASPRGEQVRLSLHYYNSERDVERAAEAVLAFR